MRVRQIIILVVEIFLIYRKISWALLNARAASRTHKLHSLTCTISKSIVAWVGRCLCCTAHKGGFINIVRDSIEEHLASSITLRHIVPQCFLASYLTNLVIVSAVLQLIGGGVVVLAKQGLVCSHFTCGIAKHHWLVYVQVGISDKLAHDSFLLFEMARPTEHRLTIVEA